MSFPACKSSGMKPRKTRARTPKAFKVQLTSLVDVMTILLVFLIKSFSAEGNVMNVPQDIKLPASTAQKQPKPAIILSINNRILLAEGDPVADMTEMIKTDDLLIEPLYNWLGKRRSMTEKIAQYSTTTEFKGEIAIQGDRKIPFRLLQKIMFTCGRVGYSNFSLAVIQEE